jgi:hypothetical protein
MLTAPTNVRVLDAPPQHGGAHAHFDALRARPDCLKAHSLRSQAQLDGFTKQPPNIFWTYDPARDTHPLRQDACKLWKPPRAQFSSWPALQNHWHMKAFDDTGDETVYLPLRIPIWGSDQSLTVTWDFWWGSEFQTNRGTVNAWKTFFVQSHKTQPTWEGSDLFGLFHELLATAVVKPSLGGSSANHMQLGGSSTRAPGVLDNDPFRPTGLGAALFRTFVTQANRWTRYLLHIRKQVPGADFTSWRALTGVDLTGGTYYMVSLWIWDETRAATRVLYEVPVTWLYPFINTLRFGFDCSTNNLTGGGLTGPIVAYARNVVALNNVTHIEHDAELFELPVAG